ncbi:hypothetical protein STEG23_022767, partial [Scotinomys teguina]
MESPWILVHLRHIILLYGLQHKFPDIEDCATFTVHSTDSSLLEVSASIELDFTHELILKGMQAGEIDPDTSRSGNTETFSYNQFFFIPPVTQFETLIKIRDYISLMLYFVPSNQIDIDRIRMLSRAESGDDGSH